MINCDSHHAFYETTGGRLNCEVGLVVEVHRVYIQVLHVALYPRLKETRLSLATIKTHSIHVDLLESARCKRIQL